MAFVDRVVEYPNRVTLTEVTGETNTYDITRAEGEVTEEGTPLNAENLNANIQEAVDEATSDINDAITIDANNNVNYRNLQSGRTTVSSTARQTKMVHVTFPRAFTKVPACVVTAQTSGPTTVDVSCGSPTTTGFDIYCYKTWNGNCTIHWIATV